jgi:hypothetical protein
VPRAWTLVFGEMAGAELPDALPPSWLALAETKGARRLPHELVDSPTSSSEKELQQVTDVVQQVKDEIPLLHV